MSGTNFVAMLKYNVCGLTLSSVYPLAGCATSNDDTQTDLSIVVSVTRTETFVDANWCPLWSQDADDIWLLYAIDGSDYFLRFPELADFRLSLSNKQITCYPRAETLHLSMSHILLDQVLPLYLSLHDDIVLHAGTVSCTKGAVAFVGPSGQGKSTLTASLCERGWQLLADDCLRIEQLADYYWAHPSYPAIRLWPDSLQGLSQPLSTVHPISPDTDKHYLLLDSQAGEFQSRPVPLRRIYILNPDDDPADPDNPAAVAIQPISGREAVIALVRNSYRLALGDSQHISKEFDRLVRLVTRVSVSRLYYPYDLGLLPQVQEAILNDLRDVSDVGENAFQGADSR